MKLWGLVGTVSGFLSVALGAFGAHALREKLSARALEIFQTGVHYQFIHALALIAVGILSMRASSLESAHALKLTGIAFFAGTLIFSGSLYALALTDIKILGAITPVGGVLFLLGWIAFSVAFWRM